MIEGRFLVTVPWGALGPGSDAWLPVSWKWARSRYVAAGGKSYRISREFGGRRCEGNTLTDLASGDAGQAIFPLPNQPTQ